MKPLFTSGPRIVMKVNGVAIAYAIGLSIDVSVDVTPINILGQFSLASLESTFFNVVTGSMQIIRLRSPQSATEAAAKAALNASSYSAVNSQYTTFDPNTGMTAIANTEGGPQTPLTGINSNSIVSQKNLHMHLNPEFVLLSSTFDIDMYIKVPIPTNAAVQNHLNNGLGATAALEYGKEKEYFEEKLWLSVKNCRLTSRNTNIRLGQVVNEPVSFQGLFVSVTTGAESGILPFSADVGVVDGPSLI